MSETPERAPQDIVGSATIGTEPTAEQQELLARLDSMDHSLEGDDKVEFVPYNPDAMALMERIMILEDDNRELFHQATHDKTTGLLNRWGLEYMLRKDQEERRAYEESHAATPELDRDRKNRHVGRNPEHFVVLIDIDNFRQINSKYGHAIGDLALAQLGKKLSGPSGLLRRTTDIVARIGGEEIIIIVNAKDKGETLAKFHPDIKEGEHYSFPTEVALPNGETITVTVSGGADVYNSDKESYDTVYQRVDKLLYQAKASGKNKIIVEGDQK